MLESSHTPTPLNVVYVGGYGRSGSSVLDRTIALQSGNFSTGELCQLFGWAADGSPCACGTAVASCEFWGPVVKAVAEQTEMSVDALHAATVSAEMHHGDARLWTHIWGVVFAEMQARGITCIIDSSKSAGGRRRAELLAAHRSVRLTTFIHLYRGLPAVINSRRRGNNLQLESGQGSGSAMVSSLRGVGGWWSANQLAARHAGLADQSISLAYEDMSSRGTQIAASLPVGDLDLMEKLGWHAIAGNRVLRSGWDGRITADTAWRRDLPARWRIVGRGIEGLATMRGLLPRR